MSSLLSRSLRHSLGRRAEVALSAATPIDTRRTCADICGRTKRPFAHHNGQPQKGFANHAPGMSDMSPEELAAIQTKLLDEASSLTRSLYRKCLRSVDVLAGGNQRDEDDFVERETKELEQFNDDGTRNVNLDRISMAPPVNRENELASRANYYKAFAREHFDGHWNLLGAHGFHIGDEGNMSHGLGRQGSQQSNQYQGGHHHLGSQMGAQYQGERGGMNGEGVERDGNYYMWREEQVQQFVYPLRSGEEKRRWILGDYEFDDPCNSSKGSDEDRGWTKEMEERLNDFDEQSSLLVKEMYRRKGWMHPGDHGEDTGEDDGFFSDSESDED